MKAKYPFLNLADTNRQYMEQLIAASTRVIESGRYIGGEEVEKFESVLSSTVGTPYAVGVANGLDALRLILLAAIELGRLKPGDRVIVPGNTFIATFLSISQAGLVPVPVDVDEDTMNLDSTLVEEAVVASGARAMAVVHLYGRVSWDRTMVDIARKHNLFVVEDVAQALGARATVEGLHGGYKAGGLGDAAAFSFYPTKNVGALGDAGAVATHDEKLAATVRTIANYGSDCRYHNVFKGINSRLDPIQAAMLNVKLGSLDLENGGRFDRAVAYCNNITTPAVRLPLISSTPFDNVWHQFVVKVDPARRDSIRQLLLEAGVETDVHYPVPPHRQPCYVNELGHYSLPVTCRLSESIFSLPIGPGTTTLDVVAISGIVNEVVRPADITG